MLQFLAGALVGVVICRALGRRGVKSIDVEERSIPAEEHILPIAESIEKVFEAHGIDRVHLRSDLRSANLGDPLLIEKVESALKSMLKAEQTPEVEAAVALARTACGGRLVLNS